MSLCDVNGPSVMISGRPKSVQGIAGKACDLLSLLYRQAARKKNPTGTKFSGRSKGKQVTSLSWNALHTFGTCFLAGDKAGRFKSDALEKTSDLKLDCSFWLLQSDCRFGDDGSLKFGQPLPTRSYGLQEEFLFSETVPYAADLCTAIILILRYKSRQVDWMRGADMLEAQDPDLQRSPKSYFHFDPDARRRSKLWVVFQLAVLFAVLLAGFGLGRLHASPVDGVDYHASQCAQTCQTAGCIELAAMLQANMDTTVDPCDDFYQYVCGGWMETHHIPDDKASYTTFSTLTEDNQQILRQLLEAEDTTSSQSDELTTASRNFYQSCLDLDAMDALGAKPIVELLAALDWQPAANKWSASDLSALQERLQLLNPWGIQPLFYMGVGASPKNSEQNVVFMGQAGLGLNKDQFLNTTAAPFKAYQTLLTTLFGLIDGLQENSVEIASRVVQFERELSLTFLYPSQRRDPVKTYNPQTFSSLSQVAPLLDWEAYFASSWSGEQLTMLNDGSTIVLESPSYLQNMSLIVVNTSKQTLVNYLQARVLTSWASRLSQPFRDANFAFRKALYGIEQEPPRWKACVSFTDSAFGWTLGRDYVQYTQAQEARAGALDMIARVKKAFEQQLVPNLSWMDAPTKAAAVEKAQAVAEQIGFPDWIMNQTRLEEYYHGLQAVPGEFAESIKSLLKWEFQKDLAKLGKPVDKSEWYMTPPTVNAYYDPSTNQMAFPAGILRPPFYKAAWPKAFSFGAIGAVMGHELTHGFDDMGSQYDKTGNLQNWWSNSSRAAFDERATCIVQQYANYTLYGQHVNGELTLGENIADNGGVKEAWLAYQSYVRQHGPERPLPALGLSSHQLFYAGFATVWCGKTRKEAELTALSTDPHAPRQFRVMGSLSNSEDFSSAFKCPAKTQMTHDPPCVVW
eukprot:g6077.t1